MVADGGLRMPKVSWQRVAHCGGSSGGLTPLGANRQWQRQGRGPAVTQGLRAAWSRYGRRRGAAGSRSQGLRVTHCCSSSSGRRPLGVSRWWRWQRRGPAVASGGRERYVTVTAVDRGLRQPGVRAGAVEWTPPCSLGTGPGQRRLQAPVGPRPCRRMSGFGCDVRAGRRLEPRCGEKSGHCGLCGPGTARKMPERAAATRDE